MSVSAGFDAHERDPLAPTRLSTDAFARMILRVDRMLRAIPGLSLFEFHIVVVAKPQR